MKSQFRTLFLTGVVFGSVFGTVCADDPGMSFSDTNNTSYVSVQKLGEFLQGFGLAVIQPFAGFAGFDPDSTRYVFDDYNSSAYKKGVNVGLGSLAVGLAAVLFKIHNTR